MLYLSYSSVACITPNCKSMEACWKPRSSCTEETYPTVSMKEQHLLQTILGKPKCECHKRVHPNSYISSHSSHFIIIIYMYAYIKKYIHMHVCNCLYIYLEMPLYRMYIKYIYISYSKHIKEVFRAPSPAQFHLRWRLALPVVARDHGTTTRPDNVKREGKSTDFLGKVWLLEITLILSYSKGMGKIYHIKTYLDLNENMLLHLYRWLPRHIVW